MLDYLPGNLLQYYRFNRNYQNKTENYLKNYSIKLKIFFVHTND